MRNQVAVLDRLLDAWDPGRVEVLIRRLLPRLERASPRSVLGGNKPRQHGIFGHCVRYDLPNQNIWIVGVAGEEFRNYLFSSIHISKASFQPGHGQFGIHIILTQTRQQLIDHPLSSLLFSCLDVSLREI